MKNIFLVPVFFFLITTNIFSESYSGSTKDSVFIFRTPVWVFVEPEPGSFTERTGVLYLPPKKAITELSAFILSGMVYGFKFFYTPYDKKRQVDEFFEIVPIFNIEKKNIKIQDIEFEYPYYYCMAEYQLPESYRQRYDFWKAGTLKNIKGRGLGDRSDEIKGIYDAYSDAIKNAIKQYGRKILKNKPKEIIGEILIKENPRLFVRSGYFTVEVECYLEITEIVPYTVF